MFDSIEWLKSKLETINDKIEELESERFKIYSLLEYLENKVDDDIEILKPVEFTVEEHASMYLDSITPTFNRLAFLLLSTNPDTVVKAKNLLENLIQKRQEIREHIEIITKQRSILIPEEILILRNLIKQKINELNALIELAPKRGEKDNAWK